MWFYKYQDIFANSVIKSLFHDNAETYICSLRLKSSSDTDMTRMQPGSSETHVLCVHSPSLLLIDVAELNGYI